MMKSALRWPWKPLMTARTKLRNHLYARHGHQVFGLSLLDQFRSPEFFFAEVCWVHVRLAQSQSLEMTESRFSVDLDEVCVLTLSCMFLIGGKA
jgi:hypothetical protein